MYMYNYNFNLTVFTKTFFIFFKVKKVYIFSLYLNLEQNLAQKNTFRNFSAVFENWIDDMLTLFLHWQEWPWTGAFWLPGLVLMAAYRCQLFPFTWLVFCILFSMIPFIPTRYQLFPFLNITHNALPENNIVYAHSIYHSL